MSFNRETNIQLNFRSIYTDLSPLGELSTHKSFDRNLIHGFVTIQIRHEPEFEMTFDDESSPTIEIDAETTMLTHPGLRRRQVRKAVHTRASSDGSRLSAIASSAYTKFRELKRRRASAKKGRNSSDLSKTSLHRIAVIFLLP